MERTLVCIPHAGGTASEYRGWQRAIPGWTVEAVVLPGRETRFTEPFLTSVESMASFVLDRTAAARPGTVALWGHSLGALVAFEVAARLEQLGRAAHLLLVAGQRAPSKGRRSEPVHGLGDAALVERLVGLGGMDPLVLQEPELLELLVPRLRADLQAAETYRHEQRPPLATPILALGGADDEHVTIDELEGWREHTSSWCETAIVAGTHFFVREQPEAVFGHVRRTLARAG